MVKLYESMASSFDKYLVEEVEEKENINECEIPEKETSILEESLKNGKTDSKEADVLDKVFAYLRELKSDEEFADFCLNKLDMTEEELKNFCGLNADGSEAIFESVEDSNNFKVVYRCENGFEGEEIVPAVNKYAAWDMFEEIAKNFDSKVVEADCFKVVDESLTESAWDELKSFLR